MTFSSLLTSVLKNSHPASYLVNELPSFSLRSAITILAPYDASKRTVAYPRPDAPPVTIATNELSSFI